jgi:hypothetical protein
MVARSDTVRDAVRKNSMEGEVANRAKIESMEPSNRVPARPHNHEQHKKPHPEHAPAIVKPSCRLGVIVQQVCVFKLLQRVYLRVINSSNSQ